MKNKNIIDIRTITADGPTVEVSATPAECAELADRFRVPGIRSLRLTGCFGRDDLITFDGRLIADADRDCVVTLKRFTEHIDRSDHLIFAEDDQDVADDPETDILPIEKGKIDLAAVMAEEFGLALSPFPKSVDTFLDYRDPSDTAPDNPFAVLKNRFKK